MDISIIVFILASIASYFARPVIIAAITLTRMDHVLFPYLASEQYLIKVITFACALSLVWSVQEYKAQFRKVLVPTIEQLFFLIYLSFTASYYYYLNNAKLHSLGYATIFALAIFFYVIFSSLFKMVDKTFNRHQSTIKLRSLWGINSLRFMMLVMGIVTAIYLFFPLRNLMR